MLYRHKQDKESNYKFRNVKLLPLVRLRIHTGQTLDYKFKESIENRF